MLEKERALVAARMEETMWSLLDAQTSSRSLREQCKVVLEMLLLLGGTDPAIWVERVWVGEDFLIRMHKVSGSAARSLCQAHCEVSNQVLLPSPSL